MNKTNIEHAVFAVIAQIVIFMLTKNLLAASLAPLGFFLGREHAQYEKKLAKDGDVNKLNPLSGFAMWNWSLDAKLDFLAPLAAVSAVCGASALAGVYLWC